MRVFITGNAGQLGRDATEVLGRAHEVAGADLPALDIADPASVARAMDEFKPDAIVNCAAWTQVDAAEAKEQEAYRANAEGPRCLGEYAARTGARVVHISTDYVFDGRRPVPEPYVESDEPGPVSAYGRTKLAGERLLMEAHANTVILRTAWLYGARGHNFLKTILKVAQQGKPLKVVNDQYGSPTWSWRLAEQIAAVLPTDFAGVAHATSEGACTWYDLAGALLKGMGVQADLSPCDSSAYPTPAQRPQNSILENARLKAAGLNIMQGWRLDLDAFVQEHREALLEETRS